METFLLSLAASLVAVFLALYADRQRLPKIEIEPETPLRNKPLYPNVKDRSKYELMDSHRFRISNIEPAVVVKWLLPRHAAIGCNAILEFSNEEKKSFIIKGRWTSSPEPSLPEFQSPIERILFPDPMTIFSGECEALDCIIQFNKDKKSYAWNNESYLMPPGPRNPSRELKKGNYKIKVTINLHNGNPISKTFDLHVDEDSEKTKIT